MRPRDSSDSTRNTRSEAAALKAAEALMIATLHDKVGHLIRRMHQVSTAVFIERAKEFDLTQLQYAALETLEACPGYDQSRLARIVALDRQTISVVIRRLVEKGLVDRQNRNGRTFALYLTGAGRATIHAMRARIGKVDETLLGPLSAPEQVTFMRLLQKLVFAHDNRNTAENLAAASAVEGIRSAR